MTRPTGEAAKAELEKLVAIETVAAALKPLTPKQRASVLNAIAILYDIQRDPEWRWR